jgi:hypothetical protein
MLQRVGVYILPFFKKAGIDFLYVKQQTQYLLEN